MTPIPTIREWQTNGETIQIGAHRIFTTAIGRGEPVLVLHGFPTASYDYARIVPLLCDRYRLILLDFLGYGFSDKPRSHDYSLFEQADIAQAAADHYGMKRGYLITHDMGNSVALEILKRGALPITKLVMLNGSVLLKYYRPLIAQRLLLNPVTGSLITSLRLMNRAAFARQFGSVFAQPPPDEEIDAFWSLIRYNNGMRIYHRLIRYLNERKIYEYSWLDALQKHTAPLMVIWGQRDPVSVPRIAEAIVERRPDATYIPFDTIGHYPQWEAPERTTEAIRTAFG
jgi:pimeloyl-ACP methyl ester carboxylesterase